MFVDRWMDKEEVVYIHSGILLSPKKELNNTIRSDMDGPRDAMLNEVGQSNTNTVWYHLHVDLKYDTDELIYKTETDSQT